MLLWVAVSSSAQTPPPTAAQQQVERTYGRPVLYVREGERFRRAQPLPHDLDLAGATVLERSPKGYLLLETRQGPVWVDQMHVRLQGVTAPAARCGAITSRSDAMTAGVRGAGEGCP